MTASPDVRPYRVLARKYRPSDFSSLIGQDAMVRTLSNAIASGRLAHAFMLTGVRGVGKTTTARIIARMLNCTGPGGDGGPTAEPCGICDQCESIAEDRNVDVIEIDAASHTGVAEMRELLEGVPYRPASARYKIYIVDEVHMLSTSSFNALLKTLEEPPEHIKFVFATTEIRKVPVTVLSRCQRFDLRRIDFDKLAEHFSSIADKEGIRITSPAVGLITRAADGSVRDGLSLLDQAIAHAGPDTEIGERLVRDMLGVAEHVRIFELFEHLMKGEIENALGLFDTMYSAGADPAVLLRDLAEITHWLTRLKTAPEGSRTVPVSDIDLQRGRTAAEGLSIPVLTRTWQMLLKGMGEVNEALSPAQTAEMVLVRIAFAADLPPPSRVVREIAQGGPAAGAASSPPPPAAAPASGPPPSAVRAGSVSGQAAVARAAAPEAALNAPARAEEDRATPAATRVDPVPVVPPPEDDDHNCLPVTFEDAVALFAKNGEPMLHAYLVNNVHLVGFAVGRISVRVGEGAPRDLAMRVSRCLGEWTGRPWLVEDSLEPGEEPLMARRERRREIERQAALDDPLVKAAIEAFPDARVVDVRSAAPVADVPEPDRMPVPDDEDDET